MQQDDWQSTIELFKKAFNDNLEYDFLNLMLTLDEREAISTRVKIVKLLLEGQLNQRELKNQLGIGIATVTRGSHGLKLVSPEFKKWLQENLLEPSDSN